MITISVNGRRAAASDLVPLPTGNVQSIKVQVLIPDDDALWQNALIVAVFGAKTPKGSWIVRPGVVDEQRQTIIPGEVLSVADAEVFIGIRGTYTNNREVTTNMVSLGKTCLGAGGEIVDTQIADTELTNATAFLSQIEGLVQSISSGIEDTLSDLAYRIENLGTPDTLVPLALGGTYDELHVRTDWQDVPVYLIYANELIAELRDDIDDPTYIIRLLYVLDESTGIPCPVLYVKIGENAYYCFGATFHDIGSVVRAAGWYAISGSTYTSTTAPDMEDMTFDTLRVYHDDDNGYYTDYSSLDDLPDEAKNALDTLSRMVNVSTDAMGTLGVVENGVQRLNHAPVSGRRYALITGDNMTFPLPTASWTGTEQAFTLDLECTTAITLTLPSTITYADGKEPDTGAGTHTLRFFRPATSTRWSVEEVKSYNPYDLPDQPVSFATIDERTLGTVLRAGHATANNEWAVTRDGVDQVWFRVGDTRRITLTDDREVTMRIIGISFDDLEDVGKAALTCDIVEALSISETTIATNNYASSNLRAVTKSVYDLFPSWVQGLCVKAKKYWGPSSYVADYTWAYSMAELGLGKNGGHNDSTYPVFTNDASRAHRNSEYIGVNFITRTPASAGASVMVVGSWGGGGSSGTSATFSDIVVGFCLNA